MSLTKEDIEQISIAVIMAMEAKRKIPDMQHQEDHEFLKVLRTREENKEKLYNAVITHVSKVGALGILTGALWCVWLVFKQKLLGQ